MANEGIRKKMQSNQVRQWQVADALGIAEGTFCRMLRKELSDAKREEVTSIIETITTK